jgi:predicted nucleic acid-binding protein
MVYFDSSAVVALYVAQAISPNARSTRRTAGALATSWLTYAEVLATLRLMGRRRLLTTASEQLAISRFLVDWSSFQRLLLDRRVAAHVRRLLSAHPLKGADAVQLASALILARRAADGGVPFSFATDNRTLARAAMAEGLTLAW